MTALPLPPARFMQTCWVVPDLDAAMQAWTRSSGVGPFFHFPTVSFEHARYRGQPAACPQISAAIAQAGEMQIELVQQHDARASIWRDVVPAGTRGLHHMALYCEDYDTALAAYCARGAEIAFDGLMMNARVCWLDTVATLGFMIELIEANPVAEAVFAQISRAAQDWDGQNAVRTLG